MMFPTQLITKQMIDGYRSAPADEKCQGHEEKRQAVFNSAALSLAARQEKAVSQWAFWIATSMNMVNPSAKGRVRTPTKRARLPKDSVKIPIALIGVGIRYFCFQLLRVPLNLRPPNQARSCCDPWAKNAIAGPKRRIKKEKDGSVGMIKLIRSPILELGW